MKKNFKLQDLDCAHCAAKMQDAISKIEGVKSAHINFMSQKLTIEAEEEEFDSIMKQVEGCNVILYTHPRTVALYEKLGFRRQKTGMAIYQGNAEDLKRMETVGFILPEGYRFHDNEYEI